MVDAGLPGSDTDGGTDPDADPGPACTPGETDSDNQALSFDGVDDHITMGVAPELGLTELTVEAWVFREGRGVDFGTGVGGLRLIPIAGKGRGENDQGNLNCNYAFGFVGGVLGADFEDSATGDNHPIVGKTAVPWGEWHHVAATYDGATWRLYVDGQLDAEKTVDATPRGDSIQHFGIGTSFNSKGEPRGFFAGKLDEVRVWNRARTADEIRDTMYRTLETAEGLVGRWALDSADGTVVDTAGENDGTLVGATLAEQGAVLDRGLPPSLSAPAPGDDGTAGGNEATLSISTADPEGDPVVVEFFARAVSAQDDFSLVVLPDTQYYSQDFNSIFHDQTSWIVENRDVYNIVGVIHNGDIVNRGVNNTQWTVADAAMSRLEEPLPDSPDGVPYGVCVGNHDLEDFTPGEFTHFDQWFGIDRFAGRSYYGGHYAPSSNSENWVTFSAGGLDFVVVNLSYDPTPSAAVIDWARSIFEAHPDAFGILNTHFILNKEGKFGAQGQAIYDALKGVDNVQLMTSGHISDEERRTDVFEGNTIHSMLADYQFEVFDGMDQGGSGFLRIWEFSPANDELTVRSYSPTLDRFLTDDNSEFTLKVDLPGAGGPFAEVNTVEASGGVAEVTYSGLQPGQVYEWYATATDCDHTVKTPVYRFTAMP